MDEPAGGPNPPVPGELRAADRDRQQVADRLREALVEGRLTITEYDERVTRAYRAVSYADLGGLLDDLPAAERPRAGGAMSAVDRRQARARREGRPVPGSPLWLKLAWAAWLTVVLVNLVVWATVSAVSGPTPFWPIWVAGPSGAVLAGVSAGTTIVRQHRAEARQRRADAQQIGTEARQRRAEGAPASPGRDTPGFPGAGAAAPGAD